MKGFYQLGILLMMIATPIPATIAQTPTQKTPTNWLDQPISNWNQFGNPIPQAPNIRGAQANINRCQAQIRQPTNPEDVAMTRFGWSLVGSIQIYEFTSVVIAASNFDEMCRPLDYQGFVFVNRQFAGTLSPKLMDSRTDGFFAQVYFSNSATLIAQFDRYRKRDPLCCPSQVSLVTYQIVVDDDLYLVRPVSITTERVEKK